MESALPKYSALRKRPFTFLAQESGLLELARSQVGVSRPLRETFRISPRFAIITKIYEDAGGRAKIDAFVSIGMRCEIDTDLADLARSGVDITGMDVVPRDPQPGERRLVGLQHRTLGPVPD